MTRTLAVLLILLLGAPLSPAWGHHADSTEKASRHQVDRNAPPFQLTDQNGRRVRLADLRGRVVLLTFIYTTCVDFCPLVTANMKRVLQRAREAGVNDLRLAFVTTDPEVDSPAVLRAYARRYRLDSEAAVFLTGPVDELRSVWGAYGVKVTKKARGLVDHTLVTVLIDQEGRLRHRYVGGSVDPNVLLADIRTVR